MLLVTGFLLLLVLMPFLFWYDTWFGRKLTDAQIDRYVAYYSKPRRQQHALVQIGERMSRHDPAVSRWYPQVVSLAASPVIELRQTAAWIMGQDHTYDPFHQALRKLLADPVVMVRRNAALALANFQDSAASPELRAMLRPFTVVSPAAGVVRYRLKPGDFVNPNTLVARVGSIEVRSPVPGEVRSLSRKNESSVSKGDPLLDVGAAPDHVWEALRALWSVGEQQDLDEVRRYARGVPGMPDRIRQQAELTVQRIEQRTASQETPGSPVR